jgi:transcriptional regulator of acetoin/glycerol metabolism
MGATAGLPSFARVVATLLQRLDPGASADARPPTLPSEVGPTASGVALRALLDEHEWNVSRVARLLSVTRMTVYNRLRRLGIARERVSKALKPRSKLPATR